MTNFVKVKSALKNIVLLTFLMTIQATHATQTTFTIGHYADSNQTNYANNLYKQATLTIPDAEALEVTIEGAIEDCCQTPANDNVKKCCLRFRQKRCCDYLLVRDSTGQDHLFNGQIQTQLTVPGNAITAIFKSDLQTTGKGVRVTITARTAPAIFNDLKERYLAAVERILEQGTGKIYLALEKNLSQLQSVTEQVRNEPEVTPDVIKSVAETLIALGQTYRQIADQREALILSHQTHLKEIEQLKAKTLARIHKVRQQAQHYTTALNEAQALLMQTVDEVKKQKIQISINGYKKNLQALHTQALVWESFHQMQDTLETQLQGYVQKIEVLLHFLKINGEVYAQAANVALLKQTTVMAFDKLVDLTELEQIVLALEQSEQAVKMWAEKIVQADFYSGQ